MSSERGKRLFRRRRPEQNQFEDPSLVAVRKAVLGEKYSPGMDLVNLGVREILLPELTPSMPVDVNPAQPILHLTETNVLPATTYREKDRVAGLAYVKITPKGDVTLEIPTGRGQDRSDTSLFVTVGKARGASARELAYLQEAQVPVGCLVTLARADVDPSLDGSKWFVGALESPVIMRPSRNPDSKQLRAHPDGALVMISGEVTADGNVATIAADSGETYALHNPNRATYRNMNGLPIEAGDELITPVKVQVSKQRRTLILEDVSPTLRNVTSERSHEIHTAQVAALKDDIRFFVHSGDYKNARAAFGNLALTIKPEDPEEVASLLSFTDWLPQDETRDERSILGSPSDIQRVRVIQESSGINIAAATETEVLRTEQVIKSVGDEEKSTFVHAGHLIKILNGDVSGAVDIDGTTQPTKAILQVIGDHFGEEGLMDVVHEQIRDRMKAYEPNVGRRYKAESEMMVVSDGGLSEQRKVFTELLLELGRHGSYDKGEYLAGILEHFLGDPDDIDIPRRVRNKFLETVIVSAVQDKNNTIALTRKDDETIDGEGRIHTALKAYSGEVSDDNKQTLELLLDRIETGNVFKQQLKSQEADVAPEYLPVSTAPAATETEASGQSQEEQPIVGGGSGENQGVETGEGTQVIEMTVYPAEDRAAALQQRAASAASFLTRSREGRGAGGPHPVADEPIGDESNAVAADAPSIDIKKRVSDALAKAIRREAEGGPVEPITEVLDLGGPRAEDTVVLETPVVQPVEEAPLDAEPSVQTIQGEAVSDVVVDRTSGVVMPRRQPGRSLREETTMDGFTAGQQNDPDASGQ